MKFKDFERIAQEAFDAVPERFREGVDGLVVSRESLPHPRLRDVYTLGHCDTESYPSDWVGPETTRSVVILYYGSFRNLARLDPDFDWDAEIHETVQHEVRHHLESLADEDALGGVDYAMDEDMKREDGEDFDPWYYQHGEPAGGGVFVVEDRVFIEQEWTATDFEAADRIVFRWQGRDYAVSRPEELGDLHFVLLDGVKNAPPVMELVLVRRRTWWEDVRRVVGSSRPAVLESNAWAESERPDRDDP